MKRWLLALWIPNYEHGGPWHMRVLATIMLYVRKAWYRGKRVPCACEGCHDTTPAASASGLCWGCAAEDCDHMEEQ
jgi:hypothetical protein